MHISIAAALLACASAVHAFFDTSPFVLFSTAELPSILNNAQLQSNTKVLATAKELLADCPTERYVVISQPDMHASDIRGNDGSCRMPNLCAAVRGDSTRGTFSVAEVVGQIESRPLADYIRDTCVAAGRAARVDVVELGGLPSLDIERAVRLSENDEELGRLLASLGSDYTVLFFSDPNELTAYEPVFDGQVHMELKRQAEPSLKARASNDSLAGLPLFEKYQFFTPAIFMGLIVLLVLLSILSVGLNALSDLKVSYGAFDKEMGPAAQKKQM